MVNFPHLKYFYKISNIILIIPSLQIRLAYLNLLVNLKLGTYTRKAFDRALQSLPITQHEKIWELYITWVKSFTVEESVVKIFRRYIMFDPSKVEEYIDYLLEIDQYEEAIRQLSKCVNDDRYLSPKGKSKYQMWMQLCDLCTNYPTEASKSIKVDAVIRSGILRFSDEVGKLWCKLANFYIRTGEFERARDIYEEGINSVISIRDFTVIYDSYVKFEEGILSANMQINDSEQDDSGDIEFRLARLEYLLETRPILLNNVALRQNPHNVQEWHKRIKLMSDDLVKASVIYSDALKTIDPKKTNGKVSGIWLSFANFYEKHKDLENARFVYDKASKVDFKNVEELAQVWCNWGEFELRNGNSQKALEILQEATTEPESSIQKRRARAIFQGQAKSSNQTLGSFDSKSRDLLYKSVTIWNLYLDLEEAFGTTLSCRAAYDKAIDLKVITPQMALNYAAFLEEKEFFEDSFRIFEQAILLFSFPHVKKIWLTYLDKFIERYQGNKIERLRDLFEQAVSKVPEENAPEFFIKYAKAEESFGLIRHALSVYDRATKSVPENHRLDMYRLYIKKVEQYCGLTKTRDIYEKAIAELNDEMCKTLCLEFAEMERKLGEIDRARLILVHGSQLADPSKDLVYWKVWTEFEESHGNEDTFREMLRIKRSVETAFAN